MECFKKNLLTPWNETDFRVMSQAQLDRVKYQINERLRKKLGFSTPKIEFLRKIS